MLRGILFSIFERLGAKDVRALLESRQSSGELIQSALNKVLLDWARDNGGQETRDNLNSLLVEHRKAFRSSNSLWVRIIRMIREDVPPGDPEPMPEHLMSVDYLTFGELGRLLLDLFDDVFPMLASQDSKKKLLKATWEGYITKLGKLRNNTAHLRNVCFQDMEDLRTVVEAMRRDLLEYGAWRQQL